MSVDIGLLSIQTLAYIHADYKMIILYSMIFDWYIILLYIYGITCDISKHMDTDPQSYLASIFIIWVFVISLKNINFCYVWKLYVCVE